MKPDFCDYTKGGDAISDIRKVPDAEETRLLDLVSSMELDSVNKTTAQDNDCTRNKPFLDLCSVLKEYLTHKLKEDLYKWRRKMVELEWTFLARLLDRLFLILYLISIILSLVFLFPHPFQI